MHLDAGASRAGLTEAPKADSEIAEPWAGADSRTGTLRRRTRRDLLVPPMRVITAAAEDGNDLGTPDEAPVSARISPAAGKTAGTASVKRSIRRAGVRRAVARGEAAATRPITRIAATALGRLPTTADRTHEAAVSAAEIMVAGQLTTARRITVRRRRTRTAAAAEAAHRITARHTTAHRAAEAVVEADTPVAEGAATRVEAADILRAAVVTADNSFSLSRSGLPDKAGAAFFCFHITCAPAFDE
jgi:hypothetical protein